jgi:hypothetical protein
LLAVSYGIAFVIRNGTGVVITPVSRVRIHRIRPSGVVALVLSRVIALVLRGIVALVLRSDGSADQGARRHGCDAGPDSISRPLSLCIEAMLILRSRRAATSVAMTHARVCCAVNALR